MDDFEQHLSEFLKERYGSNWQFTWEKEENGFSVSLQVWENGDRNGKES